MYDKTGRKIAMNESGVQKKPFRVTSYIYASDTLVQEQTKAKKTSDNPVLRINIINTGRMVK